jgi:uncharacterized membrane protein YphA (DoxX/SURF4 family)
MPASSSFPIALRRSSRRASVLLGLRLLLAADLARLALRRWNTLGASLQTLEVEGFPAPDLWLATALLASGVGIVTLLLGWRVRWGAAVVLLGFMPIVTAFSVSYVPTGWGPWMASLLLFLTLFENIALGFALMGLFFFGAGRYTLSRGLQAGKRWLCALRPHACAERMSRAPQQQTAAQR